MKSLSACLVLACLTAGSAALAASAPCGTGARERSGAGTSDSLSAAIAACTRIATPARRLDCYDALTGHAD